jgi:hypothetical protein
MNNSELQYLCYQHSEYWSQQRERMRQYTKAYKGTMFDSNADYFKISNYVTVNTADAYAYIEGGV